MLLWLSSETRRERGEDKGTEGKKKAERCVLMYEVCDSSNPGEDLGLQQLLQADGSTPHLTQQSSHFTENGFNPLGTQG